MKRFFLIIIMFFAVFDLANADCGVCCQGAGGNPNTPITWQSIERAMKNNTQCKDALMGLANGDQNKVMYCADNTGNEKIGSDAPAFIDCLKN